MNHKNARIAKLVLKGLSDERIIKVLGYRDTPEIRLRILHIRQRLME